MAGLNITSTPGVDWGQVAQAVNLSSRLQADDEAAKANAIRWQGQQDYQALVDSGVTPEDALRRTAHKLYFNEPAGVASLLRATKPEESFRPSSETIDGQTMFRMGPNRYEFAPKQAAEQTAGDLLKEELFPGTGLFAVRNPRGSGLHIVDSNKGQKEDVGLKEGTRLQLLSRVPTLLKTIQDMDPDSPQYQSASNAISQIEAALSPKTAPGSSVKAPGEGKAIPGAAIQALRANPERAAEFDQMFGAGSAAQFLKK